MPVPDVYSAGLSEFVFAAGVKIMERDRPQIMYLSTTDYIQHKHAPGTPVADDFYAMMDGYHGQARCHGLHHRAHRRPRHERQVRRRRPARRHLPAGRVRRLAGDGQGAGHPAHHRSLRRASRRAGLLRRGLPAGRHDVRGDGRQARRPCPASRRRSPSRRPRRASSCRPIAWATSSSSRPSTQVLGTSASRHDLSGLTEPLRSHGGISEQKVPLLCNRKLSADGASRHWRNFDAFDLALNLVA